MSKITTIYGEMDEEVLECRQGTIDGEFNTINWIEYWLNNELVHRSAHLIIKEGVDCFGETSVLS